METHQWKENINQERLVSIKHKENFKEDRVNHMKLARFSMSKTCCESD